MAKVRSDKTTAVNDKDGVSGERWRALAGGGSGKMAAGRKRQGFRHQDDFHDGRQNRHPGKGGTEVVRGQAQLAGVDRQRSVLPRRMLDGMRPRRQLGEDEGEDEKEMAQRIHVVKFSALNRPGPIALSDTRLPGN